MINKTTDACKKNSFKNYDKLLRLQLKLKKNECTYKYIENKLIWVANFMWSKL